jgi:hypothetical protein
MGGPRDLTIPQCTLTKSVEGASSVADCAPPPNGAGLATASLRNLSRRPTSSRNSQNVSDWPHISGVDSGYSIVCTHMQAMMDLVGCDFVQVMKA